MKQAIAKQSVVAVVAIIVAALTVPVVKQITQRIPPSPVPLEALTSDTSH